MDMWCGELWWLDMGVRCCVVMVVYVVWVVVTVAYVEWGVVMVGYGMLGVVKVGYGGGLF